MIRLRHQLLTLHPILFPAALLFGAFVALLAVSHDQDTRPMLILMATSVAVLTCVFLLLRQYLTTLLIGAQGYDHVQSRVARLEALHADEIARWERRRAGGPDTPMPVDPLDPAL